MVSHSSHLHTVLCDQENNNRFFFLAVFRTLGGFLWLWLSCIRKNVLHIFSLPQRPWSVLKVHLCSLFLNCHIYIWEGATRKSMSIGSWKEEWGRFAHRSEVHCGILTSHRCCSRLVEKTHLHECYWQSCTSVKWTNTLLSSERKFVFTVNTWKHWTRSYGGKQEGFMFLHKSIFFHRCTLMGPHETQYRPFNSP